MDPEGIAAKTYETTQLVVINSGGHFFSQIVADPAHPGLMLDYASRTGLSGNDYRAFILLHELGHLTGKFGEDPDQATNDKYSNQVLDKCFGGKQLTPIVP